MEDGLNFERQKRLYFVRAIYLYMQLRLPSSLRIDGRRGSRCLSCKAYFKPDKDPFHFMNYCAVWGFLMLLEHQPVSSQIKSCIQSG